MHSLIYTALHSYPSLLITTSIPCACVVHVLLTRYDVNSVRMCCSRASDSQSASAAILNTNYFRRWMGGGNLLTYTAILFGSGTRRSKYSHIFDRVRVLKRTFYNHHTARLPFARPVVINVYGHLVLIRYAQKAYIQPFCLDRVGTESIYTSCHLPDPSWSRTGSRMR